MNTIFRERSEVFYNKVEDLQEFYINRFKKIHMHKYYLKYKTTEEIFLMAKDYKINNKISIYFNDIEYGSIRYDRFCNIYKLYKQHILVGIFFYREGQFEFNFPNDGVSFNLLNITKFETENSLNSEINSKKNRKVFHRNKLVFLLDKVNKYKFLMQVDNPFSIMQSFVLSVIIMHKFGSYV
tara:strand:- start:1627 stop:2172 length:546 start_codon:yes stop_codon:yes gene_type:complete